ncbi:unnamed protein product [Spirodela intermedia]|uniref:Uncharacterized protein n=1 Tax=Spirodela intermedia TaxID=51605 RepID=A0ABN7EBG3_SPIIN|nr:unnamed protein product [Spirodela intermedia]
MAATTTAALGKASALLCKLTLLEGPDCGGTATTHRCGVPPDPLGGGWRFHYEEGHPLLTLTFPVRGGGRRLLSPIASRYARDAVVCGVRETQFAQMTC